MKKILLSCALVAALCVPALAGDKTKGDKDKGGKGGHGHVGAPGPTMGAGLASLPVLAVGFGIYWLVDRRRRQT